MAEELVTAVRLRRVERVGGVSDVLSAVEHSEGQAGQEVSRGQVPGNWPHLEARLGPEVPVDVLQLGDVVHSVVTEVNQVIPVVQKLLASESEGDT